MKHVFLVLLIAFGLSTLNAADMSTKASPLAEKLANTKWSMDSDSKMDSKLAWFILNPDRTVRSGWRKELGWWKAQGDASIEAQVTNKNVTRVLTFNKDITEATDQLNRKYHRLDKPATTTAGRENASAMQNPPQAPDFQTIAANRKLWPQSVVLKAATAVPIVLNGQPVGSITIPAGASVQVVSVNTNGELVIAQNGNQTKVLAEKTNIAEAYTVQQAKFAQLKSQEKHQRQLQEAHDKVLAQEAAKAKAAEELRARTKELHIEVKQVVHGGVLADPLLSLIHI